MLLYLYIIYIYDVYENRVYDANVSACFKCLKGYRSRTVTKHVFVVDIYVALMELWFEVEDPI